MKQTTAPGSAATAELAASKKPILVGTFDTSRGQAGITTHAGADSVTLSLLGNFFTATITASQAVDAAQLLLQAARIALGQESPT